MADQLPQIPDLPAAAITGMGALGVIVQIAEEVAHEVAAMGGGRYQFQPDELQSVLTQWKNLQHTVDTALSQVHVRAPHNPTVLAPGNESASTTVADAAHTTNLAYQQYLKSMQAYIAGYVTDLTNALNNYLTTEHSNASLSRGAQQSLQA
jgi:hypothetical protein